MDFDLDPAGRADGNIPVEEVLTSSDRQNAEKQKLLKKLKEESLKEEGQFCLHGYHINCVQKPQENENTETFVFNSSKNWYLKTNGQ